MFTISEESNHHFTGAGDCSLNTYTVLCQGATPVESQQSNHDGQHPDFTIYTF